MFALSAKKMALFRNADLSNFERKRSTRLVEDIGVSVKKSNRMHVFVSSSFTICVLPRAFWDVLFFYGSRKGPQFYIELGSSNLSGPQFYLTMLNLK